MCPGRHNVSTSNNAEAHGQSQTYPDDVPLPLGAKEVEKLAEIMDEARDLHPLRLSISADSLRGLQEVFDLREAGLEERSSVSSKHFAKRNGRTRTSGSESSTSVFSFSMASQIPVRGDQREALSAVRTAAAVIEAGTSTHPFSRARSS